jgi:hypothetical protein
MLQLQFEKIATLTLSTLLVSALALMLAVTAEAQVKPGDFITANNAAKVRDVVSPGVYYKVSQGMSMNIIPSERIDWPPPYRDATENTPARCASAPTIAASSVTLRGSHFR